MTNPVQIYWMFSRQWNRLPTKKGSEMARDGRRRSWLAFSSSAAAKKSPSLSMERELPIPIITSSMTLEERRRRERDV